MTIGVIGQIVPGAFERLQHEINTLAPGRSIQLIRPRKDCFPNLHKTEIAPTEHATALSRACKEVVEQGANTVLMLSVLAQLRIEKMTEWLAKRSVQPAFFNLVDLLCDAAQQSVVDKPVGYMAFETMVHAGVFERGFAQRGVECVPIEAPVRILTTVGIETFIKHGQREQAADYFIKMMRFLVKRGARSIVLGSVTIPLVVSDEQLMEIGVPIVNPFRVAAEAILLRQNEMDEKMTSSVIVEPATAAFQSC